MLARSFSETVFTRSQKARALNFKSSFAARQGNGLSLDVVAKGVAARRAREAAQGELALNLAPSCAAAAKMLAHSVLGNDAAAACVGL